MKKTKNQLSGHSTLQETLSAQSPGHKKADTLLPEDVRRYMCENNLVCLA